MCPRRRRWETVCAGGAHGALLGGPSTSPLDAVKTAFAFLIAAVVVASLTPFAIGLELAPYPPQFVVWILPVVGIFTVLIALPIFTSLSRLRQTQLLPLVAAGFVAASASFTLLELMFVHSSFAQIGDTVLVKGGWRTLAGWRLFLQQTFLMGGAGAIGGCAFWATRRLTIVGGGRESR